MSKCHPEIVFPIHLIFPPSSPATRPQAPPSNLTHLSDELAMLGQGFQCLATDMLLPYTA